MSDFFAGKRRAFMVGVSACAAMSGNGALAQDVAGAAQGLEDIVVTAQRRSENLQNVPVAVSAFSSRALEAAGITNTQALQAVVPGLVFNQSGGTSGIFLRGVGTRSAFAGLEPSTATYQDNLFITGQTGGLFELMDVDRVEVLKGPQGVLYGRNATSGAVRVISKEVSNDLSGRIEGAYGNYNDRELRATINLPASDTFGVRVAGLVHKRDGFVKNLFPGGRSELNDRNVALVRGKAKWEVTPAVTARLTVDYSRQNDASGLATVVLPPRELSRAIVTRGGFTGLRPNEASTALQNGQKQTSASGQFKLDSDLGFANLALITTYLHNNSDFAVDFDGTNVVDPDVVNVRGRNRTFSQEVQLTSSSNGSIEWIVGANYFHDKGLSEAKVALNPTLVVTTGGSQTVRTTAYAAFGQLSWHVAEEISLILGGRYTHEKKAASVVVLPGVVNPNPAFLPYRDSLTVNKFNPKAVVQWNYAPNHMLYASFTQGFKSGGFNYPPTPPAAGENPVPVLRPEILNSYELGWKIELLDRRLRLNSVLFYYDYKDLQVARSRILSTGASVTQTDNAADATVKGIETEFTFRPVPQFTFSGAGAYIDGKYKSYAAVAPCFISDPTCNPVPTAARGMISLPFSADGHRMLKLPKFSGHVSATFEPNLGPGKLPMTVTYAYKSNYYHDFISGPLTKELKEPAFGLLSVNISYVAPDERFRISAYGNNILNKHYTNFRQSTAPSLIGSYGEPRTYGVRGQFNF